MPIRSTLRQRIAFTLMELLIVVSVIAALAAMLLPAIAMVRASARTTVCMSNLRQYGFAFACYANDNDGHIPGNQMFGCEPQGRTVTHNFYGFLEPWLDATSNVFMCPDGNLTRSQWNTLKSDPAATVAVNGRTLTLAQPFDAYAGLSKVERNWYEAFCTQYTMNAYLYKRFLNSAGIWEDRTNLTNPQPFNDSFSMTLSAPKPTQTVLLAEVQSITATQVWGAPEFWWDSWDVASELRTHVQYSKTDVPQIGYNSAHNFRATHRAKGNFLYFDLHADLRDPVDLAPKGMNINQVIAPNSYTASY